LASAAAQRLSAGSGKTRASLYGEGSLLQKALAKHEVEGKRCSWADPPGYDAVVARANLQ
jgi:hypothetical protein